MNKELWREFLLRSYNIIDCKLDYRLFYDKRFTAFEILTEFSDYEKIILAYLVNKISYPTGDWEGIDMTTLSFSIPGLAEIEIVSCLQKLKKLGWVDYEVFLDENEVDKLLDEDPKNIILETNLEWERIKREAAEEKGIYKIYWEWDKMIEYVVKPNRMKMIESGILVV